MKHLSCPYCLSNELIETEDADIVYCPVCDKEIHINNVLF